MAQCDAWRGPMRGAVRAAIRRTVRSVMSGAVRCGRPNALLYFDIS